MSPAQHDLGPTPSAFWTAVQRQRGCSEQYRILADDRLIDAILAGRVTTADDTEPVVRMLALWRADILVEA